MNNKDVIALLSGDKIDEYRAVPFWSWNDELEIDELVRQVRWMKQEGFGGYFMHARSGLTTEYLGEKWFDCIEACVDEGAKLGMQNWIYDENGWPSGFVGGKLLEDIENHDRYLTYATGAYDKTALASYVITEDELIRVYADEGKECLNVYEHYSTSAADVLNPEVVDKFLKLTHEEYKNRLGGKFNKSVEGFFTDEPQYQRWATPYTKMIVKYFNEVYGQDILDGIGLLFVEKKGYKQFRYQYYKGMQKLMLDGFAKRVYDWCKANDTQFTGHYVEESDLLGNMMCCAGIMPFYEYEDMPGIDHLAKGDNSPVSSKQVYSVSRQLGKKKILTETFGCCGWDTSPAYFKKIAEKQCVNGVNVLCQHLLPYSEHGQRKRDYPAHFSWVNPWVNVGFRPFNDYFARIGYLMGESEDSVNVAVFCPIRSVYLDYKHNRDCPVAKEVDASYLALAGKLSKMNVQYHIVDETVMEKHATVKDGTLTVGQCKYDYIIFPKTLTMDKHTAVLFEEFYAGGGKMLFTDGVPQLIEGQPHEYGFNSNVTMDEILTTQEYSVSNFDTEVQTTLRSINGRQFIYAVNLSEKEVDLTFSGKFKGFDALDVQSLTFSKQSVNVHFEGFQSYILFLSDEMCEDKVRKEEIALKGEFKVVSSSDNYLTMDKLCYSADGVNYSEKLSHLGVFNELMATRFRGTVYLKYDFEVNSLPERLFFLAEMNRVIGCEVNGNPITLTGESDFDKKICKTDILKYVKLGKNEVVLKVDFYLSDHVYYVMFGENIQEGLKNCLAFETCVEACYLQGDFGVYSKTGFSKGEEEGLAFADDFYIAEKNTSVTNTVEEGYPFFAGDMTLEKTFTWNGRPCVLDLQGNYCLSEVTVNGRLVKKNYFDAKVDISDYVVSGENVVAVRLWSGNRNLLGPHHFMGFKEPISVGRDTFELSNTWVNGRSKYERENYSFVRFGLF